MKIKIKSFFNFHYTDTDLEALEHVCKMLESVEEYFGYNTKIVSPSTGEMISTDELPRIRGVLSGLFDSRFWEKEERE